MLALLFKLVIPIIAIYLVQRWVRQNLSLGGGPQARGGAGTFPRPRPPKEGDIIEICPDCGEVMQRRHRCERS